jgi:hypothetical protein
MVQAVAAWDVATYGAPEVLGYRPAQESALLAGDPIDGPPRFRRILEEAPILVSVSVIQTQAQFAAFGPFFEDTLRGGAETFSIELPLGPVTRTLYANITGPYEVEVLGRGFDHARLRMSLECFDRESTAYQHTGAVIIRSGSPGALSTTEDLIRGGTPAAPSQTTTVISGHAGAGLDPPA